MGITIDFSRLTPALGLTARSSALRTPHRGDQKAPRLDELEEFDPERGRTLLQALEPSQTLVNVITTSGDTAETMASFLIFREWLRAAGGRPGTASGCWSPRTARRVAAPDSRSGALAELRHAGRFGQALLGAAPASCPPP